MIGPKAKIQPQNFLVNGKKLALNESDFYRPEETIKGQFGQVWGSQTHTRRRRQILEKHPEVAQLLIESQPYSTILTLILVPLGLAVLYVVKDATWPVFLIVNYVVGGTINHTLHVLIHDWTHGSGKGDMIYCKFMAILCNVPMGAPSAMSFGKFHSDHHNFLGEFGKDPDLPMLVEANNIKNKAGKLAFYLTISIVYALRPVFCFTKTVWWSEIINFVVIILTDFIIWYYWGWSALLYLLLGSWLSIGPHPAAAHVLAEHYQFAQGLQTYNYFGFWNFFNLNLGYHTEHHDFPTCPWYNLPKVRAAAPQFYEHLPYHTSYTKVVLKFLFDDNFNLFNRTLRYIRKTM